MIQFKEAPPTDWSPESAAYLARTLVHIDLAIDSANGVGIVRSEPKKPKEGKIYYLKEDLDENVQEGFYVHVNDVWKRVVLEDII